MNITKISAYRKELFYHIGNFVFYTIKKHGDAQLAELKLMLRIPLARGRMRKRILFYLT